MIFFINHNDSQDLPYPWHAEYFYAMNSSPLCILLICSIPALMIISMGNNVDPDKLASSEASLSRSTVFFKTVKPGLTKTRVNIG